MKCLAIKILDEIFYNPQLKKYNFNATHSYNRKIELSWNSFLYYISMCKRSTTTSRQLPP